VQVKDKVFSKEEVELIDEAIELWCDSIDENFEEYVYDEKSMKEVEKSLKIMRNLQEKIRNLRK